MSDPQLYQAESGISKCDKFHQCNELSSQKIGLSSISPGDQRRGSRDAKVLLVTEAPDKGSSEGTPYQGSTSQRLRSMFTDARYGISITDDTDSFSEFLSQNRFYATSAIKCYVSGSVSNIDPRVIHNCKRRFLAKQIEAMSNIGLIIPMGKVAAASILGKNPNTIVISDIIGKETKGILTKDWRDPPVVVFPHPSGASPMSNPPVINSDESRRRLNLKLQFQGALRATRNIMDNLGYDVLNDDPDSWEISDRFSDFR